ncbi:MULTISPECIES: hypothetical protein [unclassified Holdemania]|nr:MULTISPECIES: hypothetical protein [unclassified Holdemania]
MLCFSLLLLQREPVFFFLIAPLSKLKERKTRSREGYFHLAMEPGCLPAL